MRRRTVCQLAFLPFLLPLVGCGREEQDYAPSFATGPRREEGISFAVHPLHNPALLHAVYSPLIDHLNRTVPGQAFRLVASRDYANFDRRLLAGQFDFALPNPYQAIRAAAAGYRIFGKMAGDENFRGLILTRRDSPVRRFADLRGRRIAFPAPTAVAATMLPQYFLHRNGLPLADYRPLYVGSMESAMESLATGGCDAAAVWPDPWEKLLRLDPDRAALLTVRWQTPALVNNALVAHPGLDPALVDLVLASLVSLDRSAAGRALLASLEVNGFERADDSTYDPVRRFLTDFSRSVRPLDLPAELA